MGCRHSIIESNSEPAAKARLRRWPSIRIALLLLLGAFSLSARQPGEHEVKAAFLFNFAKFVEWPAKAFPDPNAAVVIGIVGDDPFGDVLPLLVQGQTAQGRRIQIRHFTNENECGDCHLLFLSRSVAGRTGEILRRLQGRPVVTVSEREDFVRQGGMIGFALVDKTVRFDINTKAAEAVAVRLSSKLLAVARSVVKSS
jgi:hypothetical protein